MQVFKSDGKPPSLQEHIHTQPGFLNELFNNYMAVMSDCPRIVAYFFFLLLLKIIIYRKEMYNTADDEVLLTNPYIIQQVHKH